ncbi:MAG: hypothetical protein ACOY4K_05590 [Pseudomonadota bacterium]
MRHLGPFVVMLAVSVEAPPVLAAGAKAPPSAAPARDGRDPDRIVCERLVVVGSRRPRKVCMTLAQWQEARDRSQRTLMEGRRTTGSANAVLGNGATGPY